jgi:protein-L-isoaspartate(D-aspartate) O-methyltransferase
VIRPGGHDRNQAPGDADPYAAARARMVETHLRARGIRDPRVLAAMATVPREEFVPAGLGDLAYADEALPIEHEQTISQPLMVALMTELLAPEPGDRVLEVGTGSGYQAAVLAAMGCRVTSIERIPELATMARARLARLGYGDRVEVRVGDGSAAGPGGAAGPGDFGEPGYAPWPFILVAAAAPRVPEALTDQLADGGRLVIPIGRRYEQELILVERDGAALRTSNHGACVFVPLLGEGGWR